MSDKRKQSDEPKRPSLDELETIEREELDKVRGGATPQQLWPWANAMVK